MLVSVVLAAYNEAQNLEPVVREIQATLDALPQQAELLIVDDGSTDETGAMAERLAREDARMRVIHHTPNLGLGRVYRTGFNEARGDVVTFFPADGQFPATIIAQFLPLMAEHDLVLGHLPERDDPLIAKVLSALRTLAFNLAFGKLPKIQGVFMLRRAVLDQLELKSDGRAATIVYELIIRVVRGNYRVVSVPTPMRPRLSGESKVNNLATVIASFKQLLALRRIIARS